MKAAELRKKTKEELITLVAEKRSHIRALQFNPSSAKGANVMGIRQAKRDIARLSTILKEVK